MTSSPNISLTPEQVRCFLYLNNSIYRSAVLSCSSANFLEIADSHSRTRQKVELTRLTNQQLQELSTDVYDELIRLQSNSDIDQGLAFSPVNALT